MKRVLVLGNATLDIIQPVERLPLPGETLLSGAAMRCPGGKGLNQALAAARAGAPTRLVAPVGADADAAVMRRSLEQEADLETAWLVQPDLQTDISTIWVAADGENMIVSSAACAGALTGEQAVAASARLRAGDILLMQGNLDVDTTRAGASAARGAGATTILNTAPIRQGMAALLPCFDIVVANAVEARQLTGLDGEPAARALRRDCGGVGIVTLGGGGALLADARETILLPAPAVVVVDASGAGDVLVGSLAGFLALGLPVRRATELSIVAASASVTRVGTTASFPSRDEMGRILGSAPAEWRGRVIVDIDVHDASGLRSQNWPKL